MGMNPFVSRPVISRATTTARQTRRHVPKLDAHLRVRTAHCLLNQTPSADTVANNWRQAQCMIPTESRE